MTDTAPLLAVRGLSKRFEARPGLFSSRGARPLVHAVSDVSFSLRAREVVGLVGESGSGKTTVGRLLLRLVAATRGHVQFNGRDVFAMGPGDVRAFLRPRMRMIFQDPDASLNPGYSIGEGLYRALRAHDSGGSRDPRAAALDLLRSVGMDGSFLEKYPNELSGGEKRRIGICRALSTNPDLIVADEPLSGLDVVLQERVLGLLKEEQEKRGFALLLVSHDLERVNQVCDRVLVMHGGRLVEDVALRRDGAEVRESFRHPYSVLLQRAREAFSERPNVEREQGQGSGGDPGNRDGGCTFAAQCIMRAKMGKPEICTYVVPSLEAVAEHHAVACHFANDA